MNTSIQVVHGDCVELMGAIPSGSIDAVITDPPYGMDYQSNMKPAWARAPKILNDRRPFIEWLPEAFRVMKDGGGLACFCDWKNQAAFEDAIEAAGFTLRSQVIWDRGTHGMGNLLAEFAPQHDVIWFATKGAFRFPGKRPASVMRHMKVPPGALAHPNEKPIRLMVDLVTALCPEGGTVLDPCLGSGTTLAACEKSGRNGIGMELDPAHIPTIHRRLKAAETPLFAALEA